MTTCLELVRQINQALRTGDYTVAEELRAQLRRTYDDVTGVRRLPKKRPLTEQQHKVLCFINSFTNEHGFPPANADIASAFGFNKQASHCHVRALAVKGLLRIDPLVSRGMTLTDEARALRLTPHRFMTETRCAKCNAATFDPELTCPMCRLARLQENREAHR